MYIKSEKPTQSSDFYALDTSGELYLLEGANDKKWLSDIEGAKYKLEETKPGQYHYVSKDDPTKTKDTKPQPMVTLPTFSITGANKVLGSLLAAGSILMYSM